MHLLYTDRQTTMTRAQKKDIHGMRHFCKGDIQTIHHCRVCQMHTLIPLLGRGVLVSIIIWWTMYTLRVAVISNWNEGLTFGLGRFDSNTRLLVSGRWWFIIITLDVQLLIQYMWFAWITCGNAGAKHVECMQLENHKCQIAEHHFKKYKLDTLCK